ncbi:unnamed protein product [Rangifer tarandus platyrhynchus]|uniref:Uncharacterized protein n=2 Tax=Rangifer tarandus platyrhynchus TaxID=3082113 RepID=A0ABN8ZFK9_RANTA|nr:unnamed protein product [Rangifer tarandus platyrhynchus]CAI9708606.1 unnamed protein product [Rangifer tarandus platyrhynchus]
MQTQKAPHKSRVQVEQLSHQRTRDKRTETAEEISRDPRIPGTYAGGRLKGVSSLLQEGAPSPPPVLLLPLKCRASLRCRQAQAGTARSSEAFLRVPPVSSVLRRQRPKR